MVKDVKVESVCILENIADHCYREISKRNTIAIPFSGHIDSSITMLAAIRANMVAQAGIAQMCRNHHLFRIEAKTLCLDPDFTAYTINSAGHQSTSTQSKHIASHAFLNSDKNLRHH